MADYGSYSTKETQRTLFPGIPIYRIRGSLPFCRRVTARFNQLPRRSPIRSVTGCRGRAVTCESTGANHAA